MMAVREKILSLGILANPAKITELINILGDHIRTNMQVSEIKALWEAGKTLDTVNIINKVLDTTAGGPLIASSDSRGYFIYPRKGIDNFSELQKLAKNLFVPEEEDISAAKIEVQNGTGRSGLATTVSQNLESYGYNVTKIVTANAQYPKTIIYDYSNGKYQKVLDNLANLLHGQVEKKTGRSDIDISIILGQDYLSNQ